MADTRERAWEADESAYADADEFCDACLIDLNQKGADKVKDNCKLPVYEPKKEGGKLNRRAVHAAAVVLAGGRGGLDAPAQAKRAAAHKLVQLYRELDEEPPESIQRLAK